MIQYSNIPLWLSITSPYRWKVEKEIGRSIHDSGAFREYRLRHGCKIQDIMDFTGLSKPTIVNIERQKKRGVSDTTWLRLASFYGVIAETLYITKGRDVRTECLTEASLHGYTVQMVAGYMLKGGIHD